MPYLDRQNYKGLIGILFLHAFGLLCGALFAPDERQLLPFYWLWWIWPPIMAWIYSHQRFRWLFPVGVALPLWAVATWKFVTHAG